jgi:hypothetical protein
MNKRSKATQNDGEEPADANNGAAAGGGQKLGQKTARAAKPKKSGAKGRRSTRSAATAVSSSTRIPAAVAKIVWSKAAGLCSFPGCRKRLIEDATPDDPSATVGELAHIVAHSGQGPRAEYEPPGGHRDGEQNLVLTCPTHHTVVDKHPNTWTVEALVGIKEAHERWVRESLSVQEANADPGPLAVETVHSSIMQATVMPLRVFREPTTILERRIKEYMDVPEGSSLALPFMVRAGRLITFNDLTAEDTPFRRAFEGEAESHDARSWWADPDLSNWYVTLLNRTLNKITGRRGLRLDKDHQRYYFDADRDEDMRPLTRTVTYQSLVRDETTKKVAWQPRRKKTGEIRNYWIHLAVALRFHRVTKRDWVLSVRPERRYTLDGTQPLDGKTTGRRATSMKSHMYNYQVLAELQFWKEYLSNGQPAIYLDFGGQGISIDAALMSGTASWPGVAGDRKEFKNRTREWDLFSAAAYHKAIEGTAHPDAELPFQEVHDLLAMEGHDDDDDDLDE